MNSRVSWSVDGIDPSVRERAEAAARRAGMSLSDWLNSTIGEIGPAQFPGAAAGAVSRAEPDLRQGNARRRRHPPAAGFHHPPDRTDFTAATAQRRPAQRCAPRRARRRPAIERRHLAARRAAGPDLESAPARNRPAAGQAAPGRDGRARGSPGLSPVAADQPGVVRFGDRGNRRAPERTRQCRAAADVAAPRAADRAEPADGARDGAALRPQRRDRISPRSSAICSRSPARSRRCSAPT